MEQHDPAPSWRQQLWSAVTWDGCLPLVAACSRAGLPLLMAKEFADLWAVIFIPLLVALVRAARGKQQLDRLAGDARLWRQFLLACAIVVLMVFEGLMGRLLGDARAAAEAWPIAVTIYLAYLSLVAVALWPSARPAAE